MGSVKLLRRMRNLFIGLSKKMINEKSSHLKLEDRISILETNLDLTLKTLSIVTVQCKNAAVLIESISANQLNQQHQIQELANGIDELAAALGLFSDEDIIESDDTWN